VLLVFGAPCQYSLLAGQEHGRTIPLAELAVALPVLYDGSRVQHHDAVFAIAGRAN
jgi:hypothetical protein